MDTEQERELESLATAYPLVDPVSIPVLKQAFIDAMFVSPEPSEVFLHGLQITESFAPAVDIRTDSGPFFAYAPTWQLGEPYGRWVVLYADSPIEQRYARLILDASYVLPSFDELPSQAEPYGQFQTRTLIQSERTIKSIRLIDDKSAVNSLIESNLTFRAGYNMTIDVDGSSLTFTPSRGAGEGYPPLSTEGECPTGMPAIRSINGTPGNERRDFLIKGASCITCYCVLTPDGDGKCIDSGALAIRADCDACCSCAQYRDVYTYIDEVYEKAKRTADRITKVLAAHQASIAKLNLYRQIKASRRARVLAIPSSGMFMTLQVQLSNNSEYPVDPKNFGLRISFSDTGASIVKPASYVYNSGIKKLWQKLPDNTVVQGTDDTQWNVNLTQDNYLDMLFGWTYMYLSLVFKFTGDPRSITATISNNAGFYPTSAQAQATLIQTYEE